MKKLNIRIIAALLAAALMLAPCAAFAVDLDYSGELDPETALPAGTAGTSSNRVFINDTVTYDWDSMKYVYTVDNSLIEVYSTAMDNMVLSEYVSVSSSEPSMTVYCNGEEVKNDLTNLREVGDYVVTVRVGGGTVRLFDFSIVGETTNAMTQFSAPDGFYIETATRDGLDIYEDRYRVDMSEEGEYLIEYFCGATDRVYRLETAIDRTPPTLTFQGKVDSKQRIHSALKFSGLEEGDTIVLLQDAVEVSPVLKNDGTGQIVNPGNYIMRVYDAAGNMREYNFTIMLYFNASSWFFFLLVLAVIGAVVAYVFIKRKKLKIG